MSQNPARIDAAMGGAGRSHHIVAKGMLGRSSTAIGDSICVLIFGVLYTFPNYCQKIGDSFNMTG